MMMYIQTSKRPSGKRARLVALIISGVVIVVFVTQFMVPHFLPAIFTTVARPFWRVEFSVMSGSLDSPSTLLAQNESLRREIQSMQIQNVSIEQIQNENNDILKSFGRNIPSIMSEYASSSGIVSASTSSSTSRVLAAVLSRPPLVGYDELIIDVGSDQNVKVGDKVYAPGNILIGTTTDVLSQTSKVVLFTSPGQSYPVLVGPNNVPTTALGRGGGQYEAQIPQATNIKQGDIVSDASLSNGMFATVTSVLSNPADPYETVLFSSPINMYQLRWVLVDTNKK